MEYYIFVDESGSYNDYGTRYYVVSAIVSKSKVLLDNLHKEVAKNIKKKGHKNELKASRLDDKEKVLFIDALTNNNDIDIYSMVVDKQPLIEKEHFVLSENAMNNLVVCDLVEWIVDDNSTISDIILFNDQRQLTKSTYRDLETLLNIRLFNKIDNLDVIYKDSATNPTIQLADYVSNAVFGFFNKTNKAYSMINNKKRIRIKPFIEVKSNEED